ncbi:transposase family protein [Neobacillus drentensis]|uniref:transposase family protein n=1 Tax=Neobacillus drentensis TaxID=220684 RepID=UPI002FFEA7A6
MKFNQLKINSQIIYRGRKYAIIQIDPPFITISRRDTDGEAIEISFTELIMDPSFIPGKRIQKKAEENEKIYSSILDSLSEKDREKVSRRLNIIKPVLVFNRVKNNEFNAFYEFMEHYKELLKDEESLLKITKETLIERISAKQGVSVRTIKRYLSAFYKAALNEESQGEDGLISKAGKGYLYRSDNKTLDICHPKDTTVVLQSLNVRIDPVYIPIIKDVIENEYLTIKKPRKKAIYDSIAIKCYRNKINPPYEITIYKLLGRISEKITDRMRLGSITNQKYQDISRGYNNQEALYPLHIVEIDHTPLDLDVLDESGLVIGRPWVTLGVDVYSRKVWCLHVSFEPPSANKVRKAIEQGVLIKRMKEKYNLTNEWAVFGVPDNIVFDNGKEFDNYAIKRLINEDLKSHVRYRPIATPRYGGTIERLFGTLNTELIHRLEGTRKSNFSDLGEYDPEANALLTLRDVEEILVKYITDIYHYNPHKGLPIDSPTPVSRYVDGLKLRGYPEFISELDEPNFKIKLLPTITKPYTRDGIRLDNRLYRAPKLSRLIDKREKKYLIKYDVDDISKIYLQDPETKEYHLVPCFHPAADTVEGMNQYTFQLLRNELKKQGEIKSGQFATDEQLLKEKADLQQRIEEKYKKSRKLRLQAARTSLEVTVGIPKTKETQSKNKPKNYKDLLSIALQKESEIIGDYE